MRRVSKGIIAEAIYKIVEEISFTVDPAIQLWLQEKYTKSSGREHEILEVLLKNSELASQNKIPLCQDTGSVIVWIKLGHEVCFDESISITVNNAVKRSYRDLYLRKSIVKDPLSRINTNTNTPAIIHLEMVEGDSLEISIAVKGGGSENISALKMLTPASGKKGIIDFVLDQISAKGKNACPPLIVGVGIGGNFERCAFLAKKALFRNLGERNETQYYQDLEVEILEQINNLGLGAGGYGGQYAAMDVFIEAESCHIASLPVAVNICCHSSRHKKIIL